MGQTVDRRVKVNFSTLNEQQENKIISALMDYLAWYKRNEKEVNQFIEESGKKVNDTSLVEFWMQHIGKSEEIENLLTNMDVVADCFEYVRKYKNMVFMLKDTPEKWVCTKKYYRTEEQAVEMKKLLTEMQHHPQVKKIIEFLNQRRFDEDHIPSKYADGIIQKCRQLKQNR